MTGGGGKKSVKCLKLSKSCLSRHFGRNENVTFKKKKEKETTLFSSADGP